jgi:hypothetical protein
VGWGALLRASLLLGAWPLQPRVALSWAVKKRDLDPRLNPQCRNASVGPDGRGPRCTPSAAASAVVPRVGGPPARPPSHPGSMRWGRSLDRTLEAPVPRAVARAHGRAALGDLAGEHEVEARASRGDRTSRQKRKSPATAPRPGRDGGRRGASVDSGYTLSCSAGGCTPRAAAVGATGGIPARKVQAGDWSRFFTAQESAPRGCNDHAPRKRRTRSDAPHPAPSLDARESCLSDTPPARVLSFRARSCRSFPSPAASSSGCRRSRSG